jgi:folate-binding protein YgfZ
VLGVVDAGSAFIARTDEGDGMVFDVFIPAADRDAILAKLAAAGIEPVSDAIAEVLRIEAGRPAFGRDMDGQTIPLEAGLLERAISLTKGCYVGQEVIVRVLHRGGGRVAKRLVKLTFDPTVETAPGPGTVLSIDGHDVGRITSAAWSPRLGRVVALGYVARESAEPGRRVVASAAGGGDARADVLGLAG